MIAALNYIRHTNQTQVALDVPGFEQDLRLMGMIPAEDRQYDPELNIWVIKNAVRHAFRLRDEFPDFLGKIRVFALQRSLW
jgi:hypothetical protein